MAGGKETPRQRMIGMMYLVLTALLALNVSSAVLEKFAIINETLGELITQNGAANTNLLKAIENSNVATPEVDEAKKTAIKVRDLTKATLAYMEEIKGKMQKEPDGKEIPKEALPLNTNRAEELMLDDRTGPTLASQYEKKLNEYVEELNKLTKPKTPYKKITKQAGDYEIFKDAKPELKEKTFTMFAFQGTPTMSAIAFVSQQQSEILDYEKKALSDLLAITKGTVYEVDQLVPMVLPEANTLVAGQKYEGKLFVAGAASGADPKMFKDGASVPVQEEDIGGGIKVKMGRISFVASASDFDPKTGIAQRSYNVKISLPGRDKPLDQNIKYNVVKPKAVFSSVASSTLYLDCGNEKDVSIQGLTELSGLSLQCSGDQGKIVKLGSGKFVLIPKRPQMDITVTMDGVSIGTEKFYAKPVPEPQGILKANGAEVNKEKGVAPTVSRVVYELRIPDETFVSQNRKDAAYRVSSMVVFTPSGPKRLTNNIINLSDLGLRPGQTFTISQVQVVRSTYEGGGEVPVNCKLGDTYQIATK